MSNGEISILNGLGRRLGLLFGPVLAVVFILGSPGMVPTQASESATFRRALPGYKFSFPRDHASHEDFQTEWWYYTGHLQTPDQQRFGYELSFFRQRTPHQTTSEAGDRVQKRPKNIYLTHFTITDEQNRKFHFYEKLNRTSLNVAFARPDCYNVFNENWFVEQLGEKFFLRAEVPEAGIHLVLEPAKPPTIHGIDGVFQKAEGAGHASHYYSFSRLRTEGVLYLGGKPKPVTGISWMDHEFGSNQLSKEQIGWDWFSVQLDNNTELMVYTIRTENGKIDPHSSGTFIYANGSTKRLTLSQFAIKSNRNWPSRTKRGNYPIGWSISSPALKLQLELVPVMDDQEIVPMRTKGLGYWEGAADVTGTFEGKAVSGQAYVELTGYVGRFGKRF